VSSAGRLRTGSAPGTRRTANQTLHVTGHAIEVFARYDGDSRVSRHVNWVARAPPACPAYFADWRRFQELSLPLICRWLAGLDRCATRPTTWPRRCCWSWYASCRIRRRYGSFRAWLRQVTVNRVCAWCKRRGRQPLSTLLLVDHSQALNSGAASWAATAARLSAGLGQPTA
jgi:hypothetical protein